MYKIITSTFPIVYKYEFLILRAEWNPAAYRVFHSFLLSDMRTVLQFWDTSEIIEDYVFVCNMHMYANPLTYSTAFIPDTIVL